jgi:hypothetical protein
MAAKFPADTESISTNTTARRERIAEKENPMFYAKYDFTAKESNPGYGFANAKRAVCFTGADSLLAFIKGRENWDFSAKRITRAEAMKMLETVPGTNDKGLPHGCINSADYVTFRESKN